MFFVHKNKKHEQGHRLLLKPPDTIKRGSDNMGLERDMKGCWKELCHSETPICRRIWQKEMEESSDQYRGMATVCKAASNRRKVHPARCCLLKGIVPWKCWSLAGFSWQSNFCPLFRTKLEAAPTSSYMAEGVGGDPEWPREGPRSIPAFTYDA